MPSAWFKFCNQYLLSTSLLHDVFCFVLPPWLLPPVILSQLYRSPLAPLPPQTLLSRCQYHGVLQSRFVLDGDPFLHFSDHHLSSNSSSIEVLISTLSAMLSGQPAPTCMTLAHVRFDCTSSLASLRLGRFPFPAPGLNSSIFTPFAVMLFSGDPAAVSTRSSP